MMYRILDFSMTVIANKPLLTLSSRCYTGSVLQSFKQILKKKDKTMNKLNYISYAIFAVLFQACAIGFAIFCYFSGDYGVGFGAFLVLGGFGRLFWKRAAN